MNAVLLASNQALAAALQQLTAREPNRDRAALTNNEEDVTPLSGENEALRTSILDLFRAANPKLVAKIITKEFEPFSLWRLRIRRDSLATLEPLSFVTDPAKSGMSIDTSSTSRTGRTGLSCSWPSCLRYSSSRRWAAAQLRFHQEVVEANETYDFHQSVIKFAIQWH